MKIIKQNNQYDIYGNGLTVLDSLADDHVYQVEFNPQRGFYLTDSSLAEPPAKIYGDSPQLADYILKCYQKTDHNLGVLLSGQPGQGKTLFAKILHQHSHYPIIKVNDLPLSVIDFLTLIDQDVILLFDEFEKNYTMDDEQPKWLNFFDGITTNHFLNVLTINDTTKLNHYFFNRPSRLRYHIKPAVPSMEETVTVLSDISGLPTTNTNITTISESQPYRQFSYDELISIGEELAQGISLTTIQQLLNINMALPKFDAKARFATKTYAYKTYRTLADHLPANESHYYFDDLSDYDYYEFDTQQKKIPTTTINNTKYLMISFNLDLNNDEDYHLFNINPDAFATIMKTIDQLPIDETAKADLRQDFKTYNQIPKASQLTMLIPTKLINNHQYINNHDVLVATKKIDQAALVANKCKLTDFVSLDKLQTNNITLTLDINYRN